MSRSISTEARTVQRRRVPISARLISRPSMISRCTSASFLACCATCWWLVCWGLGPAWWFYRWAGAIGFAFGAAVSYANFRSLTLGVEGLADRIVNRDSREKGGRIVLRFLVRYGLVGVAAYAIFKGSSLAFHGFLWGLCVPVAALMAEAAWEGYAAFRRGV